jgi:hypothetical protein
MPDFYRVLSANADGQTAGAATPHGLTVLPKFARPGRRVYAGAGGSTPSDDVRLPLLRHYDPKR